MPPDVAHVRQWMRKAEHDRRTIDLVVSGPRPLTDVAAFHCQQAIEKTLKAFLIHHERPFEKIHDLRVLLLDCADVDADFEPLLDRVGPISAFAVRFRYPGPSDPTHEEVMSARAVVQEVFDFVLARLPVEVRP